MLVTMDVFSTFESENQKTPEKTVTRAVMFVPFTPNSELAKLLRENEAQLEKITGTKLRIVERTGVKFVDLQQDQILGKAMTAQD